VPRGLPRIPAPALPAVADFEPKGEVARKYGASDGTCERALYVIDDAGVIVWSYLSPVSINPGADGIPEALERLREPGHAAAGAP
jgi:alkyl hydroperoxide reductase subunit AhpC